MGTIRKGPYKGWPGVVKTVTKEALEVEVVLAETTFSLRPSDLSPHDFEHSTVELTPSLVSELFGKGAPALPQPETPPPTFEPVRTRASLLEGIRLAHLVHSVRAARTPRLADDDHLWRGLVSLYKTFDGAGNTACVSWGEAGLVALVFDHESERSPFDDPQPPDPWVRLPELPTELEGLARRAFEPLTVSGAGPAVPMVTAAAWTTGQELVSPDPWPVFTEHGGHLLHLHLLSPAAALRGLQGWQVRVGLTESQVSVVLDLLTTGREVLEPGDQKALLHNASKNMGEDTSRRILAQLGIGWS